ncbi:MAG: tRNA (uridine(34)/cytosine(34)/5-carboxymethylaminomethyluridine(34)-2'-O)-methyltransferase TrmL [Clostridia bacterium]|nr:tRNA (uridine(34)/cytosine(34)/5-carboxymethylaminomethyluridine(34)-2'-O)-methyltransferase TrmL [Clostridia bacterium]
MNVVLIEPEIPQNTGNIARTCAASSSVLHLVGPLGFSTDDRYLKRAGLDYWNQVDIRYYDSFEEVLASNPASEFYFATTKAGRSYDEIAYGNDDFIVFGKETKGLDEMILKSNAGRCIRIPMAEQARSLNLSNSVAVIIYEALRQNGFKALKKEGSPGYGGKNN